MTSPRNRAITHSDKRTVLNGLGTSPGDGTALAQARKKVDPARYGQILTWLRSISFVSQSAFDAEFPRSINQFKTSAVFSEIPFEHELRWAGAYISRYSSEVTTF